MGKVDLDALLRRLEERGFEDASETLRSATRGGGGTGSAALPDQAPEADPLPDRLGPFEIVGELGEGGFGVVLLGAQREPVRRLAAVKLLKRGMDSRSVLARFRGEQQAAALMDHRAVATVFESGVAPDGRPWFAMPLVAGIPITAHADLERLGLRPRLALFREAALGVQHAHQKGVIHRDLKPANILVGVEAGVAQPRVIDFGIAKAVEGADPLTSLATQGEAMVGTPAYMAPEQARGQAEVRSDVWALGVILGELLCGARPLDRDPVRGSDGRVETARFQRPSERFSRWLRHDPAAAREAATRRGLEPAALPAAVAGDLDAIVGRCLEEEPARRYASVGALIDDLDRHLDGRPVTARPPSAASLAWRFARRHAAAVSAAAVVALTLLVATAVSVRSAVAARREAQAATAVTDFLVQMLGTADPWRPGGQQDVKVREALDAAAKRLERGEFRGRPAEAARIELAIGAARLQLGMAQDALPSLERAVEGVRGAFGDASPDLAEPLHRLALCLQALGKLPQAEQAMRQSLALSEAGEGRASTAAVQTLNDLGLVLQDAGRGEDAEGSFRQALARLDAVPGADPAVRAGTLGNLGMLLQALGRVDEAQPLIEQALEANRARLGPDELELAMDWNNLGLLQKDRGQLAEAERSLGESLRILRKGLGDAHPNVALVQVNLADALQHAGRTEEAIELLRQAAATARAAYGPDHAEVARADNLLGFALRDAGRPAESEAAFREAVRIWRRTVGPAHPDLASGLNNLARALQDAGRPMDALPVADEAVAMIERTTADDDPRRWVFLGRRGSILTDLRRWSEAQAQLTASLAGLERLQVPEERKRVVRQALERCRAGRDDVGGTGPR